MGKVSLERAFMELGFRYGDGGVYFDPFLPHQPRDIQYDGVKTRGNWNMRWGGRYRVLHRQMWQEAVSLLKPNGLFLLGTRERYGDFRRLHVPNWHYKCLTDLGLTFIDAMRADEGKVLAFRKYDH